MGLLHLTPRRRSDHSSDSYCQWVRVSGDILKSQEELDIRESGEKKYEPVKMLACDVWFDSV